MIIISRAAQQYQRYSSAPGTRFASPEKVTLSNGGNAIEDILTTSDAFARSTLGVGTISGCLGALVGFACTGSLQGVAGGAGVFAASALAFKALDW
jgi:hypothetical protein